jgi:hypothetical protein
MSQFTFLRHYWDYYLAHFLYSKIFLILALRTFEILPEIDGSGTIADLITGATNGTQIKH